MMFMRDEKGSTSIEYAILVSLIAIGLTSSLSILGNQLVNIINNANSGFDSSAPIDNGADNRSGLGDGSNPGQGHGRDNSPNEGTNNPGQGPTWP